MYDYPESSAGLRIPGNEENWADGDVCFFLKHRGILGKYYRMFKSA